MNSVGTTGLLAIALAALWILVAAAVSVFAARRIRRANQVIDSAQAMAKLLDVGPARPMVVHADGRLEADPRLLRDLGISGSPATLGDLAGDGCGFERDDLRALSEAVETAAIACEPFERKMRVAG